MTVRYLIFMVLLISLQLSMNKSTGISTNKSIPISRRGFLGSQYTQITSDRAESRCILSKSASDQGRKFKLLLFVESNSTALFYNWYAHFLLSCGRGDQSLTVICMDKPVAAYLAPLNIECSSASLKLKHRSDKKDRLADLANQKNIEIGVNSKD